ncbi:hypothetical protein QNH36_02845 [Mesobacillus sp. AQ2]|uniref:hypothetical protein n=1 Tax=Bacillaceae TaxID=186817 RepID=UPI0011A12701|nr:MULTISPECIES: hypothetical protein [Bacillaceae]WHX41118.1 hypothetical protein QNH36_02845 [Mesobacillus sp. AQ2]
MKLKWYIFFVLLVLVLELGLLFGVSHYFETNLVDTMFLGSVGFTIIAFLFSSKGDALSKNSQVAVFHMFLGNYKPQHEKATFTINPFLVGSLLCFIAYFVLYYLGVIS